MRNKCNIGNTIDCLYKHYFKTARLECSSCTEHRMMEVLADDEYRKGQTEQITRRRLK